MTDPTIAIRWNALDRAAWTRATRDAPLQQSWTYGEAMAGLDAGVLRAAAYCGPRLAGVALFTIRDVYGLARWAQTSRGPVWLGAPDEPTRRTILSALARTAPLRRPRAVFVSPDAEAEPAIGAMARVMTGYSTAVLDLTQDEAALLAAMRGKWRNRLRAAEKSGLAIMEDRRLQTLERLLAEEAAQQRRRRYQGLPPDFARHYRAAGGAMRLWRVAAPNDADAAMLFLIHGRGATYFIGWANDAAKALNAHNALLWRAMRDLRADGARRLDLGGLDTEASPGLARFKLGAGAQPLTLAGAYYAG